MTIDTKNMINSILESISRIDYIKPEDLPNIDLYMDKVKGLISESDYVEMSKDFTTDRDRLERVITDGQKQLTEIEEKIAAGDNRRELIEQYTNLEHLTREIVETLIDYISVGKRIPGTRDVPIEIHWNF